jgi:hypothetical protein
MQVTDPLPMACTLARDDLEPRRAEIDALTRRSLISHDRVGSSLHLAYSGDALDEVRRIIAMEERCCAFLGFTIEATPAEVRLTITAPPGTDEASRWVFSRFLPATATADSGPSACGCADRTRCA